LALGLGLIAWGSYKITYKLAYHLYEDISDFKKKGEYKDALGSLKE
jgi:hypothetical protein